MDFQLIFSAKASVSTAVFKTAWNVWSPQYSLRK